ncbi:hypothetical protein HK102_010778 [Quaeritorhiza haematococci]|nr:hypothetical protein HK102_010778 [Quaeritorhiza haematococci]
MAAEVSFERVNIAPGNSLREIWDPSVQATLDRPFLPRPVFFTQLKNTPAPGKGGIRALLHDIGDDCSYSPTYLSDTLGPTIASQAQRAVLLSMNSSKPCTLQQKLTANSATIFNGMVQAVIVYSVTVNTTGLAVTDMGNSTSGRNAGAGDPSDVGEVKDTPSFPVFTVDKNFGSVLAVQLAPLNGVLNDTTPGQPNITRMRVTMEINETFFPGVWEFTLIVVVVLLAISFATSVVMHCHLYRLRRNAQRAAAAAAAAGGSGSRPHIIDQSVVDTFPIKTFDKKETEAKKKKKRLLGRRKTKETGGKTGSRKEEELKAVGSIGTLKRAFSSWGSKMATADKTETVINVDRMLDSVEVKLDIDESVARMIVEQQLQQEEEQKLSDQLAAPSAAVQESAESAASQPSEDETHSETGPTSLEAASDQSPPPVVVVVSEDIPVPPPDSPSPHDQYPTNAPPPNTSTLHLSTLQRRLRQQKENEADEDNPSHTQSMISIAASDVTFASVMTVENEGGIPGSRQNPHTVPAASKIPPPNTYSQSQPKPKQQPPGPKQHKNSPPRTVTAAAGTAGILLVQVTE